MERRDLPIRWTVTLLVVFSLGVVLGWTLNLWPKNKPLATSSLQESYPIREGSTQYRFINPLLAVGDREEFHDFKPLEQKITDFIAAYRKTHPADALSVYFRELNSSLWAGVNVDAIYAPASMYKVATMIAYFKGVETDPSILTSKITFGGPADSSIKDNGAPVVTLQTGKTYEVQDLIYRMIAYSDNQSSYLLLHALNQNALKKVFTSLGLTIPQPNDRGDTMSARAYSLFFRILYNSSYLNREMSEKALDLLSQTTYQDGIVASLPSTITVAHKFGQRAFTRPDGGVEAIELHDCGIVYYPQHPYLLCVMTRGQAVPDLQDAIQKISFLVYDNLSGGAP